MERYIGIDVHAASCTVAVISETGKKLKDFPVETNGHALVEAIRMIPGHKHLVFEEGLQSAWLYETLRPHVDEIVVAGVSQSRGQKDDKRDAYGWKFPHQNAGNPRYCRPDTKVSSGNLKEKPMSIGSISYEFGTTSDTGSLW